MTAPVSVLPYLPPNMNKPACIYVVDDDPAVLDALAVLAKSVDLNVLPFSSADQFLKNYDEGQPGCLITDVYLPDMDGSALQERLVEMGSQLPIIVMSGHGDIPLAVNMIRKGALDFIEKPFSNHLMLERIQQALRLDEQRRTKSSKNDLAQQYYAALTPRQKEVLEYLIEGLPNKVIAAKMFVSPRTIEAHRANILRKMDSDSVVSLAQKIAHFRLDSG